MSVPFEPTNSFCYRFARYQVLPEIIALPEVQNGQPFKLVELVKKIVNGNLTSEQQAATYVRAKTGELQTIIHTIKWYVPFIAKNTEQLVALGNGWYKLPEIQEIDEAEVEDEALADEEPETAASDGYIYAFSFPALIVAGRAFPIKIGMTVNDVQQRVMSQCKGAATFDNPRILAQWKVSRVAFVESAIHKTLAARGKWRQNVPGIEWFDTTTDEIKAIIEFIGSPRQ